MPTDAAERQRLGLPPFFEPYIEIGGQPAPRAQSAQIAVKLVTSPNPPPNRLDMLPALQIFEPTVDTSDSGKKVHLQSIVCQYLYSAFSPEASRF